MRILLAALLCGVAAPTSAQTTACAPLSGALANWVHVTPLLHDALLPGIATALLLAPQAAAGGSSAPDAKYRSRPLTLTISTPGRYQVATDVRGWIDLSRDGVALTSTGHEHGPACSSIRKLVTFTMTRGRYTLRLRDAYAAQAVVMVTLAN